MALPCVRVTLHYLSCHVALGSVSELGAEALQTRWMMCSLFAPIVTGLFTNSEARMTGRHSKDSVTLGEPINQREVATAFEWELITGAFQRNNAVRGEVPSNQTAFQYNRANSLSIGEGSLLYRSDATAADKSWQTDTKTSVIHVESQKKETQAYVGPVQSGPTWDQNSPFYGLIR
jgi:hypothetical protein